MQLQCSRTCYDIGLLIAAVVVGPNVLVVVVLTVLGYRMGLVLLLEMAVVYWVSLRNPSRTI
ncbi:hypothetical protein BDB00DRAFT_834083 [Zychaea mexicana]|uniref:uncharacterized protein n=1 Tax=Zychaea mexicana TaxID=64656 RepID=UPI0022FF0695|nr:uncharacterized protein BDB00DRAFT_834083 [Zychaea mexicana]KAI9491171.1 hypothetical protein BDB00DRAFT_834083 [Zychaea mexicana]